MGFDKFDNFYYYLDDGRYFKVPAGSASTGDQIGKINSPSDDDFGRLPGGGLGLHAPIPFADTGCPGNITPPYDPDVHTYYRSGPGTIYKTDKWCGDRGVDIMTGINEGPGSLVVSPDGTQIMFTTSAINNNNLELHFYIVNTTGEPKPMRLSVPSLSAGKFEALIWK